MTNPPQGTVALLTHPVAEKLLGSTELARLAYNAADGTPRLVPMLFTWDGTEFVMSTFAGAAKIRALRASPDVAVTVDVAGPPPHVLQLRGRVEITEVDGLVPEYVLAHHRYYGPEQGAANIAHLDQPGVRMARISLRPSWVGVLDFETRFPGGVS